MASQHPPRRSSWKDSAPAPASQGPTGPERAWKTKAEQAAGGKGWTRRKKIVTGIAGLVVLLGLLIWVIWWFIPPKGATMVLLGSPYEENLLLPHNLQGWQGLNDLSGLAGDRRGDLKLARGPQRLPDQPLLWTEGWDQIKGDKIVIFLALHGGSDDKGPFLFLDDPAGGQRLYMDKVLDHLQSPAFAKKKVLLILDPTQLSCDWRVGQLQNEFPERCKQLFEERKPANLYILIASQSGQRSWVSEEWGRSIFAHTVIEGLRGAADANNNSRVTVLELAEHAEKAVPAWVQANRDAVQKPLFLGDRDKAKKVELVGSLAKYSAPAPPARTVNTQALRDLWQRAEQYRAQVPSPAVYTPEVWRRYLETLLRLEQVIRAGDPTGKDASLRSKLTELEDQMNRVRRQPWESMTTSLPMAAALGVTPTWTTEEASRQRGRAELTRELWLKLLDWASAHSSDTTVNRRLLYLHLLAGELQKMRDRKQTSPEDLRNMAAFIDVVESEEKFRRPVEAHYLKLLARDLEPAEAGRAWKALDVRLQAEQAALGVAEAPPSLTSPRRRRHLYSEVVWRWIELQIQGADRARQDGENLVLAPVSADKAGEHFKQAEDEYRKARDAADIVRDALAVRDRVFSELPYYSRWVSRQRTIGGSETPTQTQMVRQHEDLWQAAHQLAAALDEPAPAPPAAAADVENYRKKLDAQVQALKVKSERVAADFKSLADSFATHVNDLPISVDIQNVWHDIEDTLTVPFIDAERRVALIDSSRKGSDRFSRGQTGQAQARPDSEATQEAAARAGREGRLAVAQLGEGRPRDARDLPGQVARGEWGSAGVTLYQGWLALADDANNAVKASLGTGELREAAKQARTAENVGRLLDGAAAARLPIGQVGPVEVARRLRLHDFLLWQIKRTSTDHLFDDRGLEPYYLPTGNTFAEDALKLVASADERLTEPRSSQVRTAITDYLQRSLLTVNPGSLNRTVTDQRRDQIAWELKMPEGQRGVPEGNPVVWLTTAGKVSPADQEQKQRQPLTQRTFPQKFTTPLTIEAIDPGQQSQVTLRGRYRGQVLDTTVQFVNQSDTDMVIYRLPSSPRAHLAIRAGEGVQVGTIVIVFDASGSMATELTGGKKRYDLAMQSLEKVLGELYRRRMGVNVQLWAFGDADSPNDEKSTRIFRVGGGSDWDPEELMRKARRSRLQGLSPIAQAMSEALASFEGTKGFRTMLVLTDGEDNLLKYRTGSDDVSAYLEQQFKAKGCEDVVVNMVMFQAGKDAEKIEKQFEYAKKSGGTIRGADDTDQLDRLLEVLSPRANLVGAPKEPDIPISFQKSLDGKAGTDLRWSRQITPATYQAELYRTLIRPKFTLTPGDRLLLGVRSEGRNLLLRRMLFAEEVRPDIRRIVNRPDDYLQRSGDWLASVVYHEFLPQPPQLRQMLALEDALNVEVKSGEVLRQIQPGFRWIEIKPRGGEAKRGTLRWWNEENFAGPAFSIHTDNWPTRSGGAPQEPEMTVWWNGSENGPNLPSDAELKMSGSGTRMEADVEGTKLQVSTTWEAERLVMVSSTGGVKPRQALVVRVEPAKGGQFPVWARLALSGGEAEGEEHHYFTNGQYTAVFYGVADTQLKSYTLHLSSVDKFKRNAAHRDLKFRLDDPRQYKIPRPIPGE